MGIFWTKRARPCGRGQPDGKLRDTESYPGGARRPTNGWPDATWALERGWCKNLITGCRLRVEVPHRQHQKGKRLHVRIDLNLPGKEIIVKREPAVSPRPRMRATTPTTKPPHADLRLVIHEASKAAGRRVQDFARSQQGRIKAHQLSS